MSELTIPPEVMKAIFNTGNIHLKDYAKYLATKPVTSQLEYNVRETIHYLLREVDRLTEENARLREALERIADDKTYCLGGTFPHCQKIAREALGGNG